MTNPLVNGKVVQPHLARKGVGCGFEINDEYAGVLCDYANEQFGGHNGCIAPERCWLDVPLLKPFIDGKHCPNCSKPNIPLSLSKAGNYKYCMICKFRSY